MTSLHRKQEVIAALIRNGRPDLANAFAYHVTGKKLTLPEKWYRQISSMLDQVDKKLKFHASNFGKTSGKNSIPYKKLMGASKMLADVIRDIQVIKLGYGLRSDKPSKLTPRPFDTMQPFPPSHLSPQKKKEFIEKQKKERERERARAA